MSTKKINAGDTLTVGDLTDDYLGAVIEVGPVDGVTHRLRLGGIKRDGTRLVTMWTAELGVKCAYRNVPVKVIAPPPVVQPDEPTILGQCIRIEGDPSFLAVLLQPESPHGLMMRAGYWTTWARILHRAGERQIIVSDPPRWPDETPDVPERPWAVERIAVGEWPDDDTHLREWDWIDCAGDLWRWCESGTDGLEAGWEWAPGYLRQPRPTDGPWTRGERVE